MIITQDIREIITTMMKNCFGLNFERCYFVVCVEHLDVYVKLISDSTYPHEEYDKLLDFCVKQGFSGVMVYPSTEFVKGGDV